MLATVVIVTLALMVGQLSTSPPPDQILPYGWQLTLLALGAGVGLSPFARGLLPIAYDAYDEFERAAIMRAGSVAYSALLALVVTALAYCAWAETAGWPRPHRISDWAAWAIGIAIIGSNLPAMFAEFAIPFPVEDDAA